MDIRVAGVKYYNVNFNKLSKSSEVNLVPDPSNFYDKNAIKVVIDGNHVGHVSRDINVFILSQIKLDNILRVSFKMTLGCGGLNNGILLSINFKNAKYDKITGTFVGQSTPYLIHRPPFDNRSFFNQRDIFEEFLRKSNLIGAKPWIGNFLYNQKVDSYYRLYHSDRFKKYLVEYFSDILLPRIGFIKNSNVDADRFTTAHENLIFSKIRNFYPACQNYSFKKHPVDIISMNFYTGKLYAIEIDGNIHGLKEIQDRDIKINSKFLDEGISVIRITNFSIDKNINEVFFWICQQMGDPSQ